MGVEWECPPLAHVRAQQHGHVGDSETSFWRLVGSGELVGLETALGPRGENSGESWDGVVGLETGCTASQGS